MAPSKKRKSAADNDAAAADSTPAQATRRSSRVSRTDPSANGTESTQKQTPSSQPKRQKKPSPFDVNRCEGWFQSYLEEGEDSVGPDGVIRLCNDLHIGIESLTILLVAWKLDASQMGFFTKPEWIAGFQALKVDSCEKLIAVFPSLHKTIDSPDAFKDLYRYAFNFSKQSGQKNLDFEVALQMWQLLLIPDKSVAASSFRRKIAHVDDFMEFLRSRDDIKVITKDQWMLFLDFATTFSEDLSTWDDENSADSHWPLMLDEFVIWKRENKLQ